jgi:hypothetical protein
LPFFSLAILIVPFILWREKGIEFDFNLKKIRRYQRSFLRRKGGWVELNQFHSLMILTKRGFKKTIGTRMTSELNSSVVFYELFLVKEDHRKRVLIESSTDKKELIELAKKIQSNIGDPFMEVVL